MLPDKGRAVVEGVNKIKRATRANPQKNIKGGILEREAPIALSNLMLVDPEGGQADARGNPSGRRGVGALRQEERDDHRHAPAGGRVRTA